MYFRPDPHTNPQSIPESKPKLGPNSGKSVTNRYPNTKDNPKLNHKSNLNPKPNPDAKRNPKFINPKIFKNEIFSRFTDIKITCEFFWWIINVFTLDIIRKAVLIHDIAHVKHVAQFSVIAWFAKYGSYHAVALVQ